VGAAVASLLGAIAGEAPLAIGLDEAHLADRGTIGALHAAMAQLRSGPVLLVVASAPADRGFPAELLHLMREVGGELPGAAVELGPLSLEDLAELVAGLAPWCQSEPERARLTRRVAFETGGNPFLAVTMLRGLADLALLRDDALEWPAAHATLESPLPFILPDLVRRAIAARLIALERDTAAAPAAATIGAVALDLELIAALTGMDARGLEPHLALLERQHFITFDAGRYAFAAPLVQQVVRNEALTPGEAQGLRLRAIAALASRNDLESRALRVELMARAMATAQAFGEAIALARDARAAESGRIAGRALLAADRIAAADPRCDRRELEALRTAPG
jgi:predicted ATPase